jgi:hypothetical protein
MKTETEAYRDAGTWVRDEIMQSTCLDIEEATAAADGFVSGFAHGMRAGSMGGLIVQGDAAEAFWRSNYRGALEYDRKHHMGLEDESFEDEGIER